jgi:branched-chain amino acid transport system ATP-binding protein
MSTDGALILATTALSKSFGGLAAVRNVSISLRRGELHALIGPNGAGKSTLVNLLSGEVKPTSGEIRLDGHPIDHPSAPRMAQAGIARSFQRTNIFPPLTILENLRLAAQAVHTPARELLRPSSSARELDARAMAVLEQIGLHEAPSRIAGTLSHGEQRLIEIAMAVAGNPRVLLLDEPLAGMGNEESEAMARLLKSLARDHAVLLIEHDMDFVFSVADRMTVMVEGSLLASGAPHDIRADAAVQRAYLGAAS